MSDARRPFRSCRLWAGWGLLLIAALTGCDMLDMYDQPRYDPLTPSNFFGDGLSARPHVEGTIPRGGLRDDDSYFLGKVGGQLVTQIPEPAYLALYERNPQRFKGEFADLGPVELRQALLERGRERFDIHCSVCHGRTGDGDGMIVRRGFRKPPSYQIERLRQTADGHIYDVITNGFGAMASYASRIEVGDRWAIVAYIRALQLSQNAPFEDVPVDQQEALLAPQPEAQQAEGDGQQAPLREHAR